MSEGARHPGDTLSMGAIIAMQRALRAAVPIEFIRLAPAQRRAIHFAATDTAQQSREVAKRRDKRKAQRIARRITRRAQR